MYIIFIEPGLIKRIQTLNRLGNFKLGNFKFEQLLNNYKNLNNNIFNSYVEFFLAGMKAQ